MTLRKRLLVISAGMFITGGVTLVALFLAPPVLLRIGQQGFAPEWSVLNPVRTKMPERAAIALLAQLRAGQGRSVLPPLRKTPIRPETLARETDDYPISSWRLVDRSDLSGVVRLTYRVKRNRYPWGESLVWIKVKGPTDRDGWSVIEYAAEY